MRNMFYVNARMLVIKGDKVLMGYEPRRYGHGGNHWETPGGGVKNGENVLSAILRESKEEIGTKIKLKNYLPFIFRWSGKELDKKFKDDGIVMFFLCDTLSKPDLKKATQKEFNELKFIDKKEFEKMKKEDNLMYFDRKYIPGMMRKLKLW